MAHQMPLAGAVHHITVTLTVIPNHVIASLIQGHRLEFGWEVIVDLHADANFGYLWG